MADARIPEIVLPDDDTHISTAIAAAKKPSKPIAYAAAACRVCGEPADRESGLCASHAHVEMDVAANKARVNAFLGNAAFRAAELVKHAAEIAAAKGDSRPAEFILLHSKVVEPVRTGPEAPAGIVINVGVVLPG